MNRDYLISKVAEQLVGKNIERGTIGAIEYQIVCVLRPFFDKEVFENIGIEKDNRGNRLYIRYKNHYLFCFKYLKTKGQTHFDWWHNYTDYSFKSFACGDQNADFDLLERIKEIDDLVVFESKARNDEFDEMLGYYNQIKTLLGDKTARVLRYIHDHRYSLEKGEL